MKKCKSCRSEIDDKAKKCPHCQTDKRNWFAKHKIISGILIFIILMMIISSNSEKSKQSFEQGKQVASQEQTSEVTPIEENNPTIVPTKPPATKTILVTKTPKNTSTTTTSSYQAIYDKYAARLKSECPSLSMTECAQLANKGVSDMAKHMYASKGTEGQYQTYSDWAGKLMDVYTKEAL